jgi:hypothetical protein
MAILTIMRDIERHVATLARRLRRGLSRLRVIDPLPAFAPAIAPAPLRAVGHDDSS